MIIGDMEIRLRADIARLQRDMDQARQVVGNAAAGIGRAADAMKNALAAIGLGTGLAEIIKMSDQYTKFTAQLRLATLSQREYTQAMADVKRISTDAQSSMAGAGTLYARIANGVRELGTTQKQVAQITEVVSLALKVSGATAEESSSAMLQLSQSFASGTLRGEEFNAVNEAAPRLMKALADGIGVPVGALKEMATNGLITSKIMADVLPGALGKLREESKEVQTISGAFQVLKDRVMEFTAVHAQANGAVSVLTGGISLLANNLDILMGAVTTLTVAKLATWFKTWAFDAYAAMVANQALAASTLASAVTASQAAATIATAKMVEAAAAADVTAATVALTTARVAELRAAIAVMDADVALAVALNGLIPAEARAAAAAEAHALSLVAVAAAGASATTTSAAVTAALGAQAAAAGIAARAMGVLRGIMGFFGGPVGLVITLLGAAALAWQHYSNSAKEEAAKAAAAVDESTAEMIDRLDKQIAKLKERNTIRDAVPVAKGASDADVDGLARAKNDMEDAQNGSGRFEGRSESGLALARINLAKNYEIALQRVTEAQRLVTEATKGTRDAQIAEWFGESGTAAQRMAAELDKLKKKFGELPPAMEAAVRAKYADKGAAAANKADLTAGLDLLKAGIDKDKSMRAEGIAAAQELGRQGLASEAQVFEAKLAATIAAGTDIAKVKAAEIAELQRYQGKDAAERKAGVGKIQVLENEKTEAVRASLVAADQLRTSYEYDRTKPARDFEEAAKKEVAAIYEQVDAVERQIASYNKLPSEISAATVAELEAQRATVGLIEGSEAAVAVIDEKIAAYKRLADSQKGLQALDTGSDVAKAKELLDILVAVDNAAKQAAQGMTDSFGRVGTAIGGLTTALTGYAVQQQAVAAQLATVRADPKSSADKIAQAELAATKASATAKVKSYADMASAAKGFFNENSKGYKVLEGAEKAFRAFEMANQLQKLATSLFVSGATATGVVAGQAVETGAVVAGQAAQNAAKVPGVFMSFMSALGPWGAAAAAVAVAAVLGGAFSGGGGGDTSKQRQETQGTGSILGDSSAKSDSIANSIELAAANSSIELTHTAGMLASLKAIENSISGLGSLLVRGTDITSLAGNVAATSSGGFFGGIVSAIFGGKTTVQDTGVTIGKGSLADIATGGVNSQSYVDTKKSGGWFSSSKYNTSTKDLGAEVDDQFAKVILSLSGSVKTAADLLGLGGDEFTKHLNTFVVDIGKISLKDLKGEEIQEQLEAVFSKLGDDMAKFAVGGLDTFAKIGEGPLETLVRIASDYANVNSIMESIGTTFGAVGMGSITAREHLIELAGGIDELASKTSSFATNFLTQAEQLAPVQKYVTDQLAAMGLASITTRDQFKAAVLGLANSGALTTEAGAAQYTALLALADAFAKTHAATVDLTKSEQDIADERKDLQTRLNEATMESAKLAELARAAIAPYNLALYDSVLAAEAAKAAADDLATANANYQQQIDALVAASQGAAAVRALETKGMAASTIALYDRLEVLKAEAKAAADAKAAVAALGKALLTVANDAFNGLTAAVNAQKKALDTALKSSMAAMQLQIDKTSASVAKLTSLSGALHSTLDSIRGQTGSAVDDRASAQAQVAAALAIAKAGGMLPDADSLKNALSTLSQDSSDQFSSYLDYQRDLYSTQNNLAALADLTDDQLSTEERALAMLEKQKDLAQLTYDAEVLRLDGLLDTAKASLDVLNGINTGVASIPAALAAFAAAIKAAMANPAASAGATAADAYTQYLGRPGSASEVDYWKGQAGNGVDVVGAIKGSDEAKIQSLYKSLLGRTGDAAGVDAWEQALAAGQSWDQIKAGFMSSDEYLKGIKGFAGGGDFMGGVRIVGENGPELEATGPSRIFNAGQTRSMLSGGSDALIAELRQQRDEQRQENADLREVIESHLYAIAKNTLNTADSLDGAINGETPIATKEVETA